MVDTLVLGTSAVKSLEVQVLPPAHHIMTEFSSPKESPSPKEQVERVVTALWEHPLLDDATVAHRKAALAALPSFLNKFGIDESEYVGVLKGSSQQIVDDTSDYDFMIIRPKEFTTKDDKFSHAQDASGGAQPKIDIFNVYGISPENPRLVDNFMYIMTQLLFTPDEYMAGNIELARQYRRAAVEQLALNPGSLRLFWGDDSNENKGMLRYNFADCFKNWGIVPQNSRSGMKMGHNPQNRLEKEQRRLNTNIELRAQHSNDPRWSEHFLQAIKELQPPSFAAYKEYLSQTDGAVHINPRFVATNLTSSI